MSKKPYLHGSYNAFTQCRYTLLVFTTVMPIGNIPFKKIAISSKLKKWMEWILNNYRVRQYANEFTWVSYENQMQIKEKHLIPHITNSCKYTQAKVEPKLDPDKTVVIDLFNNFMPLTLSIFWPKSLSFSVRSEVELSPQVKGFLETIWRKTKWKRNMN